MVFGLFEGSINLLLPKTNFSFGETIQGTLQLKLSKEKKARQLRVRITCVRSITERRVSPKGGSTVETHEDVVFSNDVVLDGEKSYFPPGGEYKFQTQLPQQNILPPQPELSGALGTAMKAMQMFSPTAVQIKWFVEGTLDIPSGIDIGKKVQISVM